MELEYWKFSDKYEVRRIAEENLEEALVICKGNPEYYEHMNAVVSTESLKRDLEALPPKKGYEDKYFLGFYQQEELLAIMDLIEGYPEEKMAWIGLFIMNKTCQGKGIGTRIVEGVVGYLKETGHVCVQLGYVKHNLQSRGFWIKNHFVLTGKETDTPDYTIVVAERSLGK